MKMLAQLGCEIGIVVQPSNGNGPSPISHFRPVPDAGGAAERGSGGAVPMGDSANKGTAWAAELSYQDRPFCRPRPPGFLVTQTGHS
jgi:hypothetical protein